jgi:hypothetical protein
MLINGREVLDSDIKGAMHVQAAINAAKYMETSAQSEIDPKKIAKSFEDGAGNFNQSDFNIFFDEQEYGEGERTIDRTGRYDTYSEMDTMEFIHRGLELIADDASQPNDEGDVFSVYSDDEKVKETINNLFIEKLDFNNELWSIIYETIKFGDNFYEIIVDDYAKPKEIKRIRYLDPRKVERIEINGKLSHFTYKTNKKSEDRKVVLEQQEYRLFPWQIIHFKIENKETAPYGGSLLKSGIRTFRRLIMLEDIMLVYRISRAPERRVFYIDVGNLNPVEAKRFLSKMKDSYRSQSFIDENGNINKKANIMSITSDIFVPVREGSQGTRIDTLAGGQSMGAAGDDPLLSYFRDKILKTMNIPPAYMGEQSDRSRSLSQLDTKFGRFIERVQAQIIKGLNKLAALELFFQGFKKEDLVNFRIELTPPSNVKEITEIDIFNQRMALIGTIQGLNLFPRQWILRKILKLSDKEIADIELQKRLEGAQEAEGAQAGGLTGDMAGMDMGGDMGGGGEMPAPEVEGGEPPEEAPAPEETPAPEGEVNAGTIINALGKDFLLENKDDFFKLLRLLEDNKKPQEMLPIFESISKIFVSSVKTNRKKNKNNVLSQMSINELKGIDFNDRKIKLYEEKKVKKNVNGMIQETIDYIEKDIKCSING